MSDIVVYAPDDEEETPERKAMVELLQTMAADSTFTACIIEDAFFWSQKSETYSPEYKDEVKKLFRLAVWAQLF